jgi:hypothetical protein
MNSSTLGSPVTTFTLEDGEELGVGDGEAELLAVGVGDAELLVVGVGPGVHPESKATATREALTFRRFMAQSYCSWCQVEK